MGKMTKIALLIGALALPAYADSPATGASSGSDSPPAASTNAPSLGAPADDGSSQLGAKSGVKARSSADEATHANATGEDYRVDVDANAAEKDSKAKASSHRVKAKAKRGKAKVKAASGTTGVNGDVGANPSDNKANASAATGTDHAINGGINPTTDHRPAPSAAGDKKVGVGASVTGNDKAAASSAAGANAGDRDIGAKAGIDTDKGRTGAKAGASAGTGAEIDDTGAGSDRR
jgi:hypothetical protein